MRVRGGGGRAGLEYFVVAAIRDADEIGRLLLVVHGVQHRGEGGEVLRHEGGVVQPVPDVPHRAVLQRCERIRRARPPRTLLPAARGCRTLGEEVAGALQPEDGELLRAEGGGEALQRGALLEQVLHRPARPLFRVVRRRPGRGVVRLGCECQREPAQVADELQDGVVCQAVGRHIVDGGEDRAGLERRARAGGGHPIRVDRLNRHASPRDAEPSRGRTGGDLQRDGGLAPARRRPRLPLQLALLLVLVVLPRRLGGGGVPHECEAEPAQAAAGDAHDSVEGELVGAQAVD